MKKLIYILFLLPIFSIAQDSTSKFSVGISFSNDWCNRFSSADDDVKEMKNEFDSLEAGKYGFTTGLFAGYAFHPSMNFQTGIYFANRGYRIDTLSESSMTNLKFQYRYIEVPLRFSYVFNSSSKLRPVLSIGCYGGYLIQQKTKYRQIGITGFDHFSDKEKLSSINLGVTASFGFQKLIQEKFTFQLDVICRQSLTPLSDTPFKRYLNSVGINLSLSRQF